MSSSKDTWLTDADTITQENTNILLRRIKEFCADRGWSETYFSKRAAGDSSIVSRLRETGGVTNLKLAKIERYLNENEKSEASDADQ